MQNENILNQYTKKTITLATEQLKSLAKYLRELTEPLVNVIQVKMEDYAPQIDKVKQFYGNNKEIILIIGATTLTYYLMRPKSIKK